MGPAVVEFVVTLESIASRNPISSHIFKKRSTVLNLALKRKPLFFCETEGVVVIASYGK